MKHLNVVLLFIGLLLLVSPEPGSLVLAQTEPRFSYPGARRFRLTSYFDHSNPNYSVDGTLTIYTKERAGETMAALIATGLVELKYVATTPNQTAAGGGFITMDTQRLIMLSL